MGKRELKSWQAVILYAKVRAAKSLRRKDPIAWAYWQETMLFAKACSVSYLHCGSWQMGAFDCVQKAKQELECRNYMKAALWYSRAKWFVIVARANGMVMNPRRTGVNLSWLKNVKYRKGEDAFLRSMAASH